MKYIITSDRWSRETVWCNEEDDFIPSDWVNKRVEEIADYKNVPIEKIDRGNVLEQMKEEFFAENELVVEEENGIGITESGDRYQLNSDGTATAIED